MLPDCAALNATPLASTNRKVLLSPRSVVLIGFQLSKAGSNGNPLSSGFTIARETVAVWPPLLGCALAIGCGADDHGARYPFSVASSSGAPFASGSRLTNCAN